jgi:hypothetical protein
MLLTFFSHGSKIVFLTGPQDNSIKEKKITLKVPYKFNSQKRPGSGSALNQCGFTVPRVRLTEYQ